MNTTYLTPPFSGTVQHCQEWTSQPLPSCNCAEHTVHARQRSLLLQNMILCANSHFKIRRIRKSEHFRNTAALTIWPYELFETREYPQSKKRHKTLVYQGTLARHYHNRSHDLNVSKCRHCLQTVGLQHEANCVMTCFSPYSTCIMNAVQAAVCSTFEI